MKSVRLVEHDRLGNGIRSVSDLSEGDKVAINMGMMRFTRMNDWCEAVVDDTTPGYVRLVYSQDEEDGRDQFVWVNNVDRRGVRRIRQ